MQLAELFSQSELLQPSQRSRLSAESTQHGRLAGRVKGHQPFMGRKREKREREASRVLTLESENSQDKIWNRLQEALGGAYLASGTSSVS